MLQSVFLLAAGLLGGGFIAYLLCRLRFSQSGISKVLYTALQEKHQQSIFENAQLQQRITDAQNSRENIESRMAASQDELKTLSIKAATEAANRISLQERNTEVSLLVSEMKTAMNMLQNDLQLAQASAAGFKAQVEAKDHLLKQQREFIAGIKAEMEKEFKLIASLTLDQNAAKLGEQQQSKLMDTLAPFRNQLDAFRKQVDEKFTVEADSRNTLKGDLHKILELNQTISRQTENLTTALTKQSKQQGGFGEDVLETILMNAGMMEGEHYYRQFSTRNEDGARIQPDIIIKRPDGLSIVVDSKVSLTHYVRYCDAGLGVDDEKSLRKEIYQSFKNHIDGLSGKKYDTIEGTADFVLMFTPAENAFTIAANHDAALRHYAFARNVFVVTPSSLLLVIKMISDLWQKDRVNKEAHDIADRAKDLYEKACNFLQSFNHVGNALDKAQSEWKTAASQLSGRGGVVRQGELLQKMLGSKTNKTLPAKLLSLTNPDEGMQIPQVSGQAENV